MSQASSVLFYIHIYNITFLQQNQAIYNKKSKNLYYSDSSVIIISLIRENIEKYLPFLYEIQQIFFHV